jgi:hypothetical protein
LRCRDFVHHHNGAVVPPYDQRLVPSRMVGVAPRGSLAAPRLLRRVPHSAGPASDRLWQRVPGASRALQLDALREDARPVSSGLPPRWSKCRWQLTTSSTSSKRASAAASAANQKAALRAVVSTDLGVGAHSGVKQQQPVRMVNEVVAQARLNPWSVRSSAGQGSAEVHPPHPCVPHELSAPVQNRRPGHDDVDRFPERVSLIVRFVWAG